MNRLKNKSELTHSMIHYLFTVHKLREEGRRSRLIDIASILGHARSSVTIAVKKLRKNGFIDEDDKNNLMLTKKAHGSVHNVLSIRMLLYFFFRDILGVSEKNSLENACRLEHAICQEIQEKLFTFMQKQMKKKLKNQKNISKNNLQKTFCSFEDIEEFIKNQSSDIAFD